MTDDDWLLFACDACADDRCCECVHLTVGAFCPHACHWLWRATHNKGDR